MPKNCIGTLMHRELIHAFDRFRIDDNAKIAVITGASYLASNAYRYYGA